MYAPSPLDSEKTKTLLSPGDIGAGRDGPKSASFGLLLLLQITIFDFQKNTNDTV
jgi:hypothetical protein